MSRNTTMKDLKAFACISPHVDDYAADSAQADEYLILAANLAVETLKELAGS